MHALSRYRVIGVSARTSGTGATLLNIRSVMRRPNPTVERTATEKARFPPLTLNRRPQEL